MPSIAAGRAVIVEAVMSALLMLVILSVATDTRAVGAPAALAIGATIALDALFGGPLTGASMNPARSFAPALVSGQWRDFWVYPPGRSWAPRSARSHISSCAASTPAWPPSPPPRRSEWRPCCSCACTTPDARR